MPENHSITTFEEFFKKNGLAFTAQRRAIAEVILSSKGHPDIEQIYALVKQNDQTASIATVYRTVNLFAELGLVERRDFKDGKSRYEIMDDKHNHIIDIETSEIFEFSDLNLEETVRKIAAEKGFDLVEFHLDLYCKKRG